MRVRTRYSDPNLLPRGYDPVGTVSDKNMSRISRCPDLKNQDLGEIEGNQSHPFDSGSAGFQALHGL